MGKKLWVLAIVTVAVVLSGAAKVAAATPYAVPAAISDLLADTVENVLGWEYTRLIVYDAYWGAVSLDGWGIPSNVDGGQGRAMSIVLALDERHVGVHDAVFDRFTPGLTEVNAAVFIQDERVLYIMRVIEGESFSFEITPDNIGGELAVVMSTNSPVTGRARVNLIPREEPRAGFLEEPHGFRDWVSHLYDVLNLDWDAAPHSEALINNIIHAGVGHKDLTLMLIEDLIELLDDFNGQIVFNDLWPQFMWMWHGWEEASPLEFRGDNFYINWPLELDHLPWHLSEWVESTYAILGVNWNAVPTETLHEIINSGIGHRDLGVIMIFDFLSHITDSFRAAEFEGLWQGILDNNWNIRHLLAFSP